jgi:hypothetical protein
MEDADDVKTWNVPLTPPTVSVADASPLVAADATTRTQTDWPFVIDPPEVVNGPAQPTE